jgi:hypothetical protein
LTQSTLQTLFQIRGSGAFQRFKHAIRRHNIADDWYRYRQTALERIAIDWLDANAIPYEIKRDRLLDLRKQYSNCPGFITRLHNAGLLNERSYL